MGCAKLKPPRRRCPNLKIVILPDFRALHPPRRAAHSSYAIKAPAAGAATRAARASLPGHWAVCMLLWAHPRGPIADPLLYLGHCRPHLPSPRYFADFPPMLRSYPLRARSAGPPRPRFPLILRRAASNCVLIFFARVSVARLRGRQGAPGCPRSCGRAETCGVEASAVSVREGGVLSRQPQARYGWVMMP